MTQAARWPRSDFGICGGAVTASPVGRGIDHIEPVALRCPHGRAVADDLAAGGRRGRLAMAPDTLFAYGTLQFRGVLGALLRRVPEHAPGTVTGWRVAALAARTYPGMVPAGQAPAVGILISGLTP